MARTLCEFRSIEKVGPTRFDIVERCLDLVSGAAHAERATYEMLGERAYRRIAPRGSAVTAHYCAQSALPEPWRTNQVDDLLR
ncbi:hypothetical protein [Enterovirga aerilata]|uniref:Uncharacterized protein n=1 Tax=Enterovirga aerilata TaxID=2730920 RepID=A0A849I946_9HYPH|nr:hypothetical protein [Enterovirga sp. DB1703]NNM74324.1 hypothetical protein [Enterovirga sp. DB1703]